MSARCWMRMTPKTGRCFPELSRFVRVGSAIRNIPWQLADILLSQGNNCNIQQVINEYFEGQDTVYKSCTRKEVGDKHGPQR